MPNAYLFQVKSFYNIYLYRNENWILDHAIITFATFWLGIFLNNLDNIILITSVKKTINTACM